MATESAIESLDTDILVLGAGGAGLCAALHAADRSPHLEVTVAVKGLLGRAGCTRMVQVGYNAVLAAPDSLEAHLLDTLQGGGWINDQELVYTLVKEAPGRVLELAPPTLVYVSCQPATFADNAARFVAGGYRLEWVRPVDMFPQTPHIEAVARFTR